MGRIKFTNLKLLHNDMKLKSEDRATFPYQYNGADFSCIFLTDIVPYRLYLTTLGISPLVFEFESDEEYNINGYIDKYKELVNYLNIKFDPKHKFMPSDFLNDLNMHVPTVFRERPHYTDTIRIIAKTRKIEEANKVYFCGWRRNPVGASVQDDNYEKTKGAFGDEKANMSRKKNISSCWTDTRKGEIIRKLNDIITM